MALFTKRYPAKQGVSVAKLVFAPETTMRPGRERASTHKKQATHIPDYRRIAVCSALIFLIANLRKKKTSEHNSDVFFFGDP